MSDESPFAAEAWEADLVQVIEQHEVDQLSRMDANLLADHLAIVVGSLARLMRKRDENAPAALSVSERAELAALRRVNRLQEVMIAQKNEALANLKILLKDAYVQRDRVLGELRSSAETAGNKKLDCSGVIQVIEHYLQYDLHESHEESALVMESGDAWRVLAEIGAALDKAKWLC